jgi:hypothetical protein
MAIVIITFSTQKKGWKKCRRNSRWRKKMKNEEIAVEYYKITEGNGNSLEIFVCAVTH